MAELSGTLFNTNGYRALAQVSFIGQSHAEAKLFTVIGDWNPERIIFRLGMALTSGKRDLRSDL